MKGGKEWRDRREDSSALILILNNWTSKTALVTLGSSDSQWGGKGTQERYQSPFRTGNACFSAACMRHLGI